MELRTIPLHLIDRDPTYQIRQRWDPATDPALAALAGSLAGPEGLLHPLIVVQRPTPTTFGRLYTLIAGWRRLAAAQRLGWQTILARVEPACDLDAPATRLRLLAMAVRENTERQDLHPEDRRVAVQRLQALSVPSGRTSSSPPWGWRACRRAGCCRYHLRPRPRPPSAWPMRCAPVARWP